jgi:hypothetical protein
VIETAFLRRAAAAAGVLCALLVVAHPAQAAFPGRNGLLTYAYLDKLVTRKSSGAGATILPIKLPVSSPTYSPRGKRLAFTAQHRVWIVNPDGSGLRSVTDGTQEVADPAWSPDGAALAFTEGAPGATHIAVVGADGRGARRLTYTGVDRSPAWSVRDRIAFVRHTTHGGDELYATNTQGTSSQRLTSTRGDEEAPAWSPDGRRIAFSSGSAPHRTIAIMGANGGKAKRVTARKTDAAAPAWSPDGRRLAMTVRSGKYRKLAVMSAKGGRIKVISKGRGDAGPPDWQPTGLDPIIAAAGDIACDPLQPEYNNGLGTRSACHQMYTSDILLKMDLSAALVVGDAQYQDGRADAWVSFDSSWGRLGKPLFYPVPGNHEYRDPGGSGYFDYFNGTGSAYGRGGARGFGAYSFDVGEWHIIALNSACADPVSQTGGILCNAGSPQETWLRQDLAAHPAKCTLAFFHHPLWSSGYTLEDATILPLWEDLYNAGADVVVNGHDHAYERFAPFEPGGAPDSARGMREFLVGTGGKSLQRARWRAPNSVKRKRAFGVLTLTLSPSSYTWKFISEAGNSFTDSGSTDCH